MDWFDAQDYEIARGVLQRGVAAIYLIAFLSSLNQFRVLCGENGLLPAPELIAGLDARRRRRATPGMRSVRAARETRFTLFRWGYTDARLLAVCWSGMALAASVVLGLPQLGPAWAPLVVFLALWLLYMSIVNVGQTFYGFGWEMLLLEAGFTVAFLGSHEVPPPTFMIFLLAWLVFRLEFGAGMIKMRGDPAWRNLTALYYHHQTQPMPGPLSRQAHLAPKWWHRVEVFGNHVAQLIVPFLLFLPQPVASAASLVVILTQLWLVVTGNFAWLNWITIVLAFARISDPVIHWALPFIPADLGAPEHSPVWWMVLVSAVAALLVVLSWWPLRNLLARRQLMNASFNGWQLENAYGAFGSVTRERVEVIIEATMDASPENADWSEYEFKGKPGDVRRIPRQWAPYHLRLDWLMWFLPLGSVHEQWLYALLAKLLEADAPTLRMLRSAPFGSVPPRYVRVRTYHYRFSTRAELRESGQRWIRTRPRVVIPATQLRGERGSDWS
ncbi:lipase maturation factor family protein [Rathayibacter sp. YIM 133350]|uniref:lipase maturation factor family protein n=1 Tax=Rathayibacter sp. YIM 133350 TaxID=3131992 RepID=UPI00307FCCB1